MNFAVVGMGYVGLSLATLLATKYQVFAVDIYQERVDKINKRISPLNDKEIIRFFKEKDLKLIATLDYKKAYINSDYVIIATPTDYDEISNTFNTDSIELVVDDVIKYNTNAHIIIKSTIPISYTQTLKNKYNKNNIAFFPEFLREGSALYDNLYPSRIIAGSKEEFATNFAEILQALSKNQAPIIYMDESEAEAIKLFSNTYLAMRIAFFNELDTFAEVSNLNTQVIIEGVGLDPRIGKHYNNPSFGYGGYCLPKDTKQIKASYKQIPNKLISAIVDSNTTRKKFIANQIINKNVKVVGVYKLAMKKDSDNYRSSAVIDIIDLLVKQGQKVIIYESSLVVDEYEGIKVYNDFNKFVEKSDLIVANRIDKQLEDIKDKVYTRDIFNEN